MEKETKLYLLLGLYVGALYASNLLGGKLLPIGDRGLTVGIIMFPFLFLITDIVGEVYGKKKSKQFVNIGLISLVALLIWQIISVSVPGAVPNPWYEQFNAGYQTVFGMTITFTIASILAFFFGQYVDVAIYHLMKSRHGKKYMWLRNNISTALAQFVDSSIWVLIAFSPRLFDGTFTILTIYGIIIIPYWLAKIIVAIIDTPLLYLGVRWLKK